VVKEDDFLPRARIHLAINAKLQRHLCHSIGFTRGVDSESVCFSLGHPRDGVLHWRHYEKVGAYDQGQKRETGRVSDSARIAYQRAGGDIGGATVTDAHYRSVDDHDRPYTVTAATAEQVSPERINLTTLKADVTLNDGTWLMLQAKHGVFLQHANQLDLSGAVTLYRDDGTTMTTASASVDLKNGAAASAEPTHAEGPFGTLDAQGFTLTDKGTAIQFAGPAHLVLNGSSP